MDNLILSNILILTGIGLTAAGILYLVSKKFNVTEDPRIAETEAFLPGANCGACGRAGCHDFAVTCVNAGEEGFSQMYCPVGGQKVMEQIAAVLGFTAAEKAPTCAVLKCNGTCENAPTKITFDGVNSCRIAAKIAVGRTGCPNGCLRFGDCAKVCRFGALHIDKDLGIPVVDKDKCTSCGACVNICPRHLFEIRPKGPNNETLVVACSNTQKGATARKNCKAACIGCMKCTKVNPEVKVENNLSYIPTSVDAQKFGTELAAACPTGAIIYTGKGKESADEK